MDIDSKTTASTFSLRPLGGEMLKPAELVEVEGAEKLTLNARRAFNLLLPIAHGPNMAVPHKRFTIFLAALKFPHSGNERLAQAIKSLMRRMVTILFHPAPETILPVVPASRSAHLRRS